MKEDNVLYNCQYLVYMLIPLSISSSYIFCSLHATVLLSCLISLALSLRLMAAPHLSSSLSVSTSLSACYSMLHGIRAPI